jgi:hypothetical protein
VILYCIGVNKGHVIFKKSIYGSLYDILNLYLIMDVSSRTNSINNDARRLTHQISF